MIIRVEGLYRISDMAFGTGIDECRTGSYVIVPAAPPLLLRTWEAGSLAVKVPRSWDTKL